MKLTYSEIHTRLVLANCCLADLAIEYLEAERLGDESRMSCKLEEGFLLSSSIDRLKCFRPSISGGSIWKETFSGTITPASNASIAITFMGYTIMPTYGVPDVDARTIIPDTFNAYYSQDWTILRSFMETDSDGNTVIYVQYDPDLITPSTTPITVTTVGGTYTSEGDGTITTSSPWSDRTSNADAEKMFAIIDSICDCPCKKTDQEITDDTLPKYVRTE